MVNNDQNRTLSWVFSKAENMQTLYQSKAKCEVIHIERGAAGHTKSMDGGKGSFTWKLNVEQQLPVGIDKACECELPMRGCGQRFGVIVGWVNKEILNRTEEVVLPL